MLDQLAQTKPSNLALLVQATLQKEYGLVMKENNTLKEHVRRLQTDLSTTMDRTDALLKERQNLQQRLHHEVWFELCIDCLQCQWSKKL